jgi:hypothetical protein
MKEVYNNRQCNIAASGSPDSRGGLFYERDSKLARPITLHLRRSGSTATPKLFSIVDLSFWEKEIEGLRLSQRGWVLQERVLSHVAMFTLAVDNLFGSVRR